VLLCAKLDLILICLPAVSVLFLLSHFFLVSKKLILLQVRALARPPGASKNVWYEPFFILQKERIFMNLKTVSPSVLIDSTKRLVSEERRITTEVLHHLLEIDRRRLYAESGYSSLFEFCRCELGYSDGAAYRRISAMTLLRDLPEAEEKIRTGSLSLSSAAQVQSFFVSERKNRGRTYDQAQRHELLERVSGKSRREAERELIKVSPEYGTERPEHQRELRNDRVELCFSVSRELHENLKRIQDLRAHVMPWSSYESLLEDMSEIVLNKIDPMRKKSGLKSVS
jgi:hypothetical protein